MEREQEMPESLKAEMEALPRERTPGRLLEERTVAALRARGLLAGSRLRPGWLVAGLAAALALFVSGFAAGQWTTQRSANETILSAQRMNSMQAAYLVQETGSAYLEALSALSAVSDSGATRALDQGREAAASILAAAATELVRLSPDDELSLRIRNILNARDTTAVRSAVVWF